MTNAFSRCPVVLTALVVAFACSIDAQVSVSWNQPTRGVSVASDPSNAVFTIFHQYALGAEITLTKRDVLGNLLWTASYDQTDNTKWEMSVGVASDSQGNAIVTGTLMSGYSNPTRVGSILMKFAPNGTFLWRQVYEGSFDGSHVRRCLVNSADEIYVFGTGDNGQGLVCKVKKFAPNGTPLWTYLDSDGIGAPLNAKFTPDGDILMIGRAALGSLNGFARIDQNGIRRFGIGSIQSANRGDAAGDRFGNTFTVGQQPNPNGPTLVTKYDLQGNVLWQLPFNIAADLIESAPDDAPIMVGFPSPGNPGAAFLKVDQNGIVVWSNPDADGPESLVLHNDLLVDASGDAYLGASNFLDMAVCKVRSDGTSAYTVLLPDTGVMELALSHDDSGIYAVGGRTARLVDEEEGPWTDLGGGLAGTSALVPHLWGVGSLQPATSGSIDLRFARPHGQALLVIGTSASFTPLYGGILIPTQDIVIPTPMTGSAGAWSLPFTWPPGVPSGTMVYLQAGINDSGSLQGVAGTNAIVARIP